MLKLTLLQTASIELNGEPVSLPFKRADALLYYLAVKHSASREELVSLLWENSDMATGLKNLRNTLYTLKKSLGEDVLVFPQKSLVALNPDYEIQSDYNRFVREGDISAYQGSFLRGFSIKNALTLGEWISRTGEKLHRQYLRALEERARAARQAGQTEEAARWADLYLEEEPYDEGMVSFLMELLREQQKFAAATRVYQQLREQLGRELGVEPLESTTMLYYEILNLWNDISNPVGKQELCAPAGREQVYNSLRAAAASFLAQPGRRCALLFTGTAGSGKSELINFFLQRGEFPSLMPLRCEFLPSERQNPSRIWYRILRPLLDSAAQHSVFLPQAAAEQLSAALARLSAPGEEEQFSFDPALEESILLCFELFGREKKLLLILEDLQWADRESLRPLSTLLRNLKSGSMLCLLTSTMVYSDEVRRFLEELEADGLLQQQELPPLSPGDTRELLRRELGEEAAGQLAPRFYRETGGNLKLLMSLSQACRQNRDVEAALRSMSSILLKRLKNLPPEAEEAVQKISLFPEGVSSALLLTLMDGREQELISALQTLRRREIVEERHSGNGSIYGFVHDRIRELVYDRLSAYERQHLHRAAARALIASPEPSPLRNYREAAAHFSLAGDEREALRYRVHALNLETTRRCEPFTLGGGELSLPGRLFRDILEEAEDCVPGFYRFKGGMAEEEAAALERELILIRGRLSLFSGDIETAYRLLGSLRRPSRGGSAAALVKACELLAHAACCQQSADKAERYVSAGMHLLEGQPDGLQSARFYRLRGSCFCLRGDYDRAAYYMEEASQLLSRLQPGREVQGLLAAVYGDMGRISRYRNDFVHAARWFRRALDTLGSESCAGRVLLYVHYGRTVFAAEDHARARELFSEAYHSARESEELWGRCAAAAFCAYYEAGDGNHAEAARLLSDAGDAAEKLGSPLESCILHFVSMHLRLSLERDQWTASPLQELLPENAEEYARRGIRLCRHIPDIYEAEQMRRSLRAGISSQLRYKSSDLYSKNKSYMAE